MKILKGKYPPVKGYGVDITGLLDRCLAISTSRRRGLGIQGLRCRVSRLGFRSIANEILYSMYVFWGFCFFGLKFGH